jgi:hypothetical protein
LERTFHHHHLQVKELHFENRGSSMVRGSNNCLTKDGPENVPARQKKNMGKNPRKSLDATGVEDNRAIRK